MPDNRPINRERAFELIRRDKQRFGRDKQSPHHDTMEQVHQQRRALDGICGACGHLVLEAINVNGQTRLGLGCNKFHSPVQLYAGTELGGQAFCIDYDPAENDYHAPRKVDDYDTTG